MTSDMSSFPMNSGEGECSFSHPDNKAAVSAVNIHSGLRFICSGCVLFPQKNKCSVFVYKCQETGSIYDAYRSLNVY